MLSDNFYHPEQLSEHMWAIWSRTGEVMYLIVGTNAAALVDTCVGVGNLRSVVEDITSLPVTVLITHGHVDHAMGAALFDTVYMNSLDRDVFLAHRPISERQGYVEANLGAKPGSWTDADWVPVVDPDFHELSDGMCFDLGGVSVEAYALPGHTPGCMVMLVPEERALITGDAANNSTFLFDEWTLPVEAYRRNLTELADRLEGRYDRCYVMHHQTEASGQLLRNVIAVCDDILQGNVDDQPYSFRGHTYCVAKAANERFVRNDGGEGNIVYNKERECARRIGLAPIFASGMVLQRDMPVSVWGSAEANARIEVRIQGQSAPCTADARGSWRCTLTPLHTSEAEVLEVASGNALITLSDVAVGEVFVAGGQSNMEFWMRYDKEVEQYRPTCNNPRIRFFDQPKCSYPGQTEDFDYSKVGIWRKATPDDLDYFSAVGYYFARGLEMALDVPVGIVGCNYGGTASSAWMKPDHARVVQPEQAAAFDAKLQGLPYEELLAHGGLNADKNDKGNATWAAFNEFFLPKTPTEDEARAFMQTMAQGASGPADVGGLEIGGAQASDRNDARVHPGIMTPTKEAPGALFTYMVLPIAGFATRGVLWYQGESDDEVKGAQWRYEEALRTIIADWRDAWQRSDLPFLVVQLPGFGSWLDIEANDFVTIRACQQKVADEDEHVWLCSIADMGDKRDIHPKEKKPVGERLALLAMRHLLGIPVPADAPRCIDAERKGSFVVLRFQNAEGGMVVAGAEANALEVLCDGSPVPFKAAARGDELIVMLEGNPSGTTEVRFAQTNWFRTNLYNSAEIPALPFAVRC